MTDCRRIPPAVQTEGPLAESPPEETRVMGFREPYDGALSCLDRRRGPQMKRVT